MKAFRFTATALVVWLSLVTLAAAADSQVIYVVRHAERADSQSTPPAGGMMSPSQDPPLSAAGQERAAKLATMLRSSGIKAIYTTEFQRTRLTAEPTGKTLGVDVTVVPSKDAAGVIAKLGEARVNALVVGHSNTVPDLLKRLGVKDSIAIPDSEYDNLFIVVRPEAGEPTLIRLRF